MVAARGPVYRSASKAGDGNRYHTRCGCTVEPYYGDPKDWEPSPEESRFMDAYLAVYRTDMSTDELSDAIEAWLAEHGGVRVGASADEWARWKASRDVRIGLTREQRDVLFQIQMDEEQVASLLARIEAGEESESVLNYLRTVVEESRRRIAEMRDSLPADMGRLDFDPDNPLSVYGNRLVIQDEAEVAVQHLRDLEAMPRGFHEALADHFGERESSGFYIGDRAIPDLDDLGDLRGAQPRGWPPGSTWDTVPGAYHSERRVVACGGGGHGHGATSLAMHEGSHALDDALGKISSRPEFAAKYQSVLDAGPTNPYMSPAGNPTGYLSEGFAEGFAAWAQARHAPRADVIQAVGKALSPHGINKRQADAIGDLIDYFSELERSARRK